MIKFVGLGAEEGVHGGAVVAHGTPEDVAAEARSYTGQYLPPMLEGVRPATGGSGVGRALARSRGLRAVWGQTACILSVSRSRISRGSMKRPG